MVSLMSRSRWRFFSAFLSLYTWPWPFEQAYLMCEVHVQSSVRISPNSLILDLWGMIAASAEGPHLNLGSVSVSGDGLSFCCCFFVFPLKVAVLLLMILLIFFESSRWCLRTLMIRCSPSRVPERTAMSSANPRLTIFVYSSVSSMPSSWQRV